MLLYLFLFPSQLFLHTASCASFTSSFQCHVSHLLLLHLFLQNTSSHATKTLPIKCPHKFGATTSTKSITLSSNLFPIITSFSKFTFLLSHIFFTTFLIFFYLYLLPLMHVVTPQGLPSHKQSVFFFTSTKSIYVSFFSHSECHLPLS